MLDLTASSVTNNRSVSTVFLFIGFIEYSGNFNIPILEDAAEGIGSYYKKRHVGTIGKIGIISFNGNKTITTGGGGVILTNDNKIAKIAKHITTTAKIPHQWEYNFDEVGYNYRIPNINAALGIAQLENLSKLLLSKRKLFKAYEEAFKFVDGVFLKKEPKGSKSNYWLQALVIDKIPKHIVIIGAGAIGIEFAYFFNTFGREVTIIEAQKHILPNEDIDISKELERIFKSKKINIKTNTMVENISGITEQLVKDYGPLLDSTRSIVELAKKQTSN